MHTTPFRNKYEQQPIHRQSAGGVWGRIEWTKGSTPRRNNYGNHQVYQELWRPQTKTNRCSQKGGYTGQENFNLNAKM